VMRLASDDEASGTHWEVLHGATFTTAYAELEVEHFSLYAVMMLATGQLSAGATSAAVATVGAAEAALPALTVLGGVGTQVAAIAAGVQAIWPAVQAMRAFWVARNAAHQVADQAAAAAADPEAQQPAPNNAQPQAAIVAQPQPQPQPQPPLPPAAQPVAVTVAVPWELLIFACSPTVSPLPQARKEANSILAQLNGQNDTQRAERPWRGRAHIYTENGEQAGTPQGLSEFLIQQHPRRFHFAGHGDVPLGPQTTLAFTDATGAMNVVDQAVRRFAASPLSTPLF